MKAAKMKLGAFLESGDYIKYEQLLGVLGKEGNYKLISWVEKRNFPLRTQKVRNKTFYVIKIEEFWKWAEENRELLDFSKLEENILGKEPEWVKQKRRVDFERNRKYKMTPWTKTEDEQLIFLLRQQKYNYQEISQKLGRTEGAIWIRISKLKIKDRPLKAERQTWTEEQKEKLICLIKNSYSYELIAERLGYSSGAVRGFLRHTYGVENLDKVRKALKEHERL